MADSSILLQQQETTFRAFVSYFEELKNRLQTKGVATKLFQEQVITMQQFRSFTSNISEHQICCDTNHKILDLMLDKTLADFHKFLNIITSPSFNCQHIANKIKQATNTIGNNTTTLQSAAAGADTPFKSDNDNYIGQPFDKWGNQLRGTFDFFAGKLSRNYFKKIANKLELDRQAIEDITQYHHGGYDQYYELFMNWSQCNGKLATLGAFIQILSDAGMNTAIDEYYVAVNAGKISWN